MVYTDGVHLVANTLEELHEFAKSIGLKRHYYEGYRKGHPHYDLMNDEIRNKVKLNGAKLISSKEIVQGFQNGTLNQKYARKR